MKKVLAILMAGVLCLGTGVTAFATESNDSPNESPSTSSDDDSALYDDSEEYDDGDIDYVDDIYTWGDYYGAETTITSGSGTASKITDEDMLAITRDFLYGDFWLGTEGSDALEASGIFKASIYGDDQLPIYVFDVTGVSGKITVSLGNGAEKYAGNLCRVYHYNTVAEKWETMSSFAKIDSKGQIAIKFDSYSPIVVQVLAVTENDVASGKTISVLTTAAASSSNTAAAASVSPKTGDNDLAVLFVVVGICALGGAVVTRRCMAR